MWNNFKDLPACDVCAVLDDDDCSATEKEIFDAAVAWLNHEVMRTTSCCAPQVLAAVRFPLMSRDDLQTCAEQLASSDIPPDYYSTLLEEARTYHCKAGDSAVISSRRTQMRNSVDVIIALGGFTASEQTTNRFQVLPIAELLAHSTKEIRFDFHCMLFVAFCLQCFDAVGRVAGRASGLQKLSSKVLAWLSVWSEVQMISMWSS